MKCGWISPANYSEPWLTGNSRWRRFSDLRWTGIWRRRWARPTNCVGYRILVSWGSKRGILWFVIPGVLHMNAIPRNEDLCWYRSRSSKDSYGLANFMLLLPCIACWFCPFAKGWVFKDVADTVLEIRRGEREFESYTNVSSESESMFSSTALAIEAVQNSVLEEAVAWALILSTMRTMVWRNRNSGSFLSRLGS